ncbi:MAG: SDR family oxidoreductase [Thermomicrobiales bacterium]
MGQQGDISDRQAAESLIDLAVTTYGRLDILCNNAGIMDYMQGVGELDGDLAPGAQHQPRWSHVYEPARSRGDAAPGSGSIINIASIGGLQGGAAGAAYTVSKHALIGLTRNTALMYARQGIRCNAICPGATATNIAETMPPERLPNGVGAGWRICRPDPGCP